ncbi:phospholipase [Polymorphobacter multimanifer]|uniref:Phospholipase A1 n=1 Tax=Polymorphobacter multimanifer TaxID=1070431 RepID=A0A841L5X9_9SPHN|nr:outer membrane phospholipase A [Polymorphobacter multimanifer]GGI88332.1 phospholipase [Polymorphobacter multimanifer]
MIAALSFASPAAAAVEMLIGSVSADDGNTVVVDIRFLNTDRASVEIAPPEQLNASLARGAEPAMVVLERIGPGTATVPAGGFLQVRYRADLQTKATAGAAGTATLSLANGSAFAFALPAGGVDIATAGPVPTTPGEVAESFATASPEPGNAFIGNLSTYEPMYAVYGPGTNSAAKVQLSLKYQLFGVAGSADREPSWLDGLHFAYTQRLFWDVGKRSSPFRNVDYMPELVYILPKPLSIGDVMVGGQAGLMHQSNGRDGVDSRSLNMIYIQPVATMTLGAYRVSVGPRLWAFVGDRGDNPDIGRFRGNTGLFAEIGTDGGLRVTTNTRLNPGSGKGSIDVLASYPINRLVPKLNLYVFGQGFVGYGENLLDYNRHQTRLRVGLGFVR